PKARGLGRHVPVKKVIFIVLAVILLPVISIAVGLGLTFRGLTPVPEAGADLPGGARLVNDGWAAFVLLPAPGASALIDCGDDPTGKVILEELKKKSLGPDDVKAIFLTHGHPDHIASCH